MLLIDEQAALAAIPSLLPDDVLLRRDALTSLRQVLEARGELSQSDRERLARIEALFGQPDPSNTAHEQLNSRVKFEAS